MKIDELRSKGINIDAALENWGDIDSYTEALNEYLEALDEKLISLKEYKNNKDLENYAIIVHGLKSESRYLGLEKEAEIFLNHELKSKENNQQYIEEHFEELTQLISNIKEMFMGA